MANQSISPLKATDALLEQLTDSRYVVTLADKVDEICKREGRDTFTMNDFKTAKAELFKPQTNISKR